MESVPDRLVYLQVRHAIQLLRYGNKVERDILKLLASVQADLLERIAGRLATIDDRGFDTGPVTTKRIEALLKEVSAVNDGVYSKTYAQLTTELAAFAVIEATYQAESLERALDMVDLKAKLPSPTVLRKIATERPIQGSMLKSFVNGMAKGNMDRIERSIRIGMTEGQGVEAIVRRIRTEDMEVSKRSARSIVRTSINHVANQAAQEVWRENESVVKGWQFIATLDSRTTIVCASLDGKIFKVGEGPVPPRHPSCRSVTIAVTKTFKELGLDRNEYTLDQRASIDGQVSGSTDFDKWLTNQSAERQETVLGKKRAELWRNGKLDLNDFVRDGSTVITLDELRKLHPEAFS